MKLLVTAIIACFILTSSLADEPTQNQNPQTAIIYKGVVRYSQPVKSTMANESDLNNTLLKQQNEYLRQQIEMLQKQSQQSAAQAKELQEQIQSVKNEMQTQRKQQTLLSNIQPAPQGNATSSALPTTNDLVELIVPTIKREQIGVPAQPLRGYLQNTETKALEGFVEDSSARSSGCGAMCVSSSGKIVKLKANIDVNLRKGDYIRFVNGLPFTFIMWKYYVLHCPEVALELTIERNHQLLLVPLHHMNNLDEYQKEKYPELKGF